MITVSEHLKKGIDNFLEFTPEVTAHMENKENPHVVTKEQIGLSMVDNKKQATKEELENHKENINNPHAVTKEQIGLSKVTNDKQVEIGRYTKHVDGSGDKHNADDILYDGKISVKERIEEIVVGKVEGTVYHNELLNRDNANQHPMSAIENAGEILLFEGVTQNGEETEILTLTESDFVFEGGFTLPDGYAADVEISVLAVREQEGIIKDRNVTLFKDNYLFAKINSMNWFNSSDKTSIKEVESAWDNDSGEYENIYSCSINKNDFEKRTLTVKGAEGHTVYWRGIFRIRNIIKVGE